MEIFHQIKSDALRTFLSLVGVSVGIFVVTVAFAVVDAFKAAVVAGFDHFGSDMIMVERFPVTGGEGADWSRYAARPQPSREDYLALSGKIAGQAGNDASVTPGNDASVIPDNDAPTPGNVAAVTPGLTGGLSWIAFAGEAKADVVYAGKRLSDCKLIGVSGAWEHLVYSSVCQGRAFSAAELGGGDAKVILGAKAARSLLGSSGADICGSSIRIEGRSMTVVGVLSEEGKNIINLYATDYALVVPFATAQQIAGREALETMIAIGPGAAGRDAAMAEATRLLRAGRGLKAAQEDNFALNTMEDLCRETVALTSKISIVGILVALFSLLIGGFGIVNIMLVSVKERSYSIGLKMALGAQRRRILLEFMLEALLLSVFGAALGLLLAWGAVSLIPSGVLSARLTATHVALAFTVAVVLGLASGIAPAARASHLNPVDALRG